jgi:hypothetical protein
MELPSNPLSDVVHYKYWTHQISTHGVSGAYSGEYPETAAIYPPVTMYGYRVAGWLYRHLYDPSFDMAAALTSHELTDLVKLVAVVPHLVSILVIYGLLRRRFGSGPALAAAAAIGLNPAAIFDAAFWGQPDIVHALLLLIAIYCFEDDMSALGFVLIWDHNPLNPYWPILMKRVPQDHGDERLVSVWELLNAVRTAGLQAVEAARTGLVPDFMPAALMPIWTRVESMVEANPFLSLFAAHNVVVAQKPQHAVVAQNR